jgi:hypothetical protein
MTVGGEYSGESLKGAEGARRVAESLRQKDGADNKFTVCYVFPESSFMTALFYFIRRLSNGSKIT